MQTHEPRTKTHPQRKCIGFTEALEQKRAEKEAKAAPQSWLLRKLTVFVVVAIVCYSFYIYVARFCVPMIRREGGSLGGRAMGIAFLVVFCILFLLFGWAYAKVVFTSPGYAKDYVSKTLPPAPQPQAQPYSPPWDSEESIAGTPYNNNTPPSRSRSRPSIDIAAFSTSQSSPRAPRSPHPSRSPPHSRRNTHETPMNMTQVRPPRADGGEAGALEPPPPASLSRTTGNSTLDPSASRHPPASGSGSGLPPPLYSRRPPTHPALAPEYRYCSRDGFVKPMRAHHCRACGTCVLKYDHHCPWIGQCVGAYNHKFFVNFLQWSTIFTIFIFVTLVVLNTRSSTSSTSIDPQHIVLIVLSGIFTLFTFTLFASHVHLILLNSSTVEHLGMQRMRERETSVLSHMTSFPCPCSSDARQPPEAYGLADSGGHSPFKVLTTRRRILKQWDMEWGSISTEGNIWWLGSRRANWEATMGKTKLGWLLPIGRSLGDGLTYPTNPRFDREGRWRRRAEWPQGLR